jgi:ribosomal protein S18 acetylase RimI-like enzyme
MNWLLNTQAGLVIRSLTKQDVDAVVALSERSFNSRYISGQVREALTTYCGTGADKIPLRQQKATFIWVSYYVLVRTGKTGEELLGITGLYHPVWAGEGVYWLGWYGVDSRFQGQGYGILLLKASMVLARAQGGRILCVETSPGLESALKLYLKMGFYKYGEVPDYWSAGENLIILGRHLEEVKIPDGVDWNG